MMEFNSNVPKKYKVGLIGCKVIRALHICSDWNLLNEEMEYVKEGLVANGFPINIINRKILTRK